MKKCLLYYGLLCCALLFNNVSYSQEPIPPMPTLRETLKWLFGGGSAYGFIQTHTITSLDGQPAQITVIDDWERRRCSIRYGSQAINAFDNRSCGPIKCSLLTKQLLQITYDGSHGSQGLKQIVIVTVKKGKLYTVLCLEGESEWALGSRRIDGGLLLMEYKVGTKILQGKTAPYSLEITTQYKEDDEGKRMEEPARIYRLTFDTVRNIFYQKPKRLTGLYAIRYWNEERGWPITWRKFDSNYPSFSIFSLNLHHYYFIDGIWYRDEGKETDAEGRECSKVLERTYDLQ